MKLYSVHCSWEHRHGLDVYSTAVKTEKEMKDFVEECRSNLDEDMRDDSTFEWNFKEIDIPVTQADVDIKISTPMLFYIDGENATGLEFHSQPEFMSRIEEIVNRASKRRESEEFIITTEPFITKPATSEEKEVS